MPCVVDIRDPNERELESKRVATLIRDLFPRLKLDIPVGIGNAADEMYGSVKNLDEWTDILCHICSHMSKENADKYIYNGRSKSARALAEWWDEHQENDRQRLLEKIHETEKKEQFDAAWAKLSPKERRVIQDYFESQK